MKQVILLSLFVCTSLAVTAQSEQEIQRLREEMEVQRAEMERQRAEMERQRQLMEEQSKELRIQAEEWKRLREQVEREERDARSNAPGSGNSLPRPADVPEPPSPDRNFPEDTSIPEPPEVPTPSTPDGEVPEPPDVEVVENGDTTRIRVGKSEVLITEDDGGSVEINLFGGSDKDRSDRSASFFGGERNRIFGGLEFGVSGFSYGSDFTTSAPDELEGWELNYGRSINWAINPVELDVRLINEHVKFSTGLGFNVRNFSFRNNYRLFKANDSIAAGISGVDLEKNRLRVGYLTVPAMLYFNSHKDPSKAFRIGAGAQAGLRLFQTYRTKHFADGQKFKDRTNRGWNTNLLTLEGRGVVGYGPVNLYATYSFVQLFEDDRGPELYPFTVGISFTNIFW